MRVPEGRGVFRLGHAVELRRQMMRGNRTVVCRGRRPARPVHVAVRRRTGVLVLMGCMVGLGLTVVAGCQSTAERMVTVHRSAYEDVDQTCEVLEQAIEAEGFHCKGILNLNRAVGKHGVELDRQVRIVQFGRPEYAQRMLADSPEVCALMPCAFGVYEGDDGGIYVSGMNRELMARMFGGTVAEVMSERVARDEAEVFNALKHRSPR